MYLSVTRRQPGVDLLPAQPEAIRGGAGCHPGERRQRGLMPVRRANPHDLSAIWTGRVLFCLLSNSLFREDAPGHLLRAGHHIQHPAGALALGADEPQVLNGGFVGRGLVADDRRHPAK